MAPLLSEEEQSLDPYLLLNLPPTSSDKEIQKAYRKLSLKYHPDKNSTPEGAIMFRKITVSLDMLLDSAKRTYIDTRLESDRKKKERQAQLQGRKREMVEALEKREEEAKRAKVDQARRRKEENEEEGIKEAGRRMVEEAQKRAAAAQAAQVQGSVRTNGSVASPGGSNGRTTAGAGHPNGGGPMPPIGPMDLTLFLTIPLTLDTSSLEPSIRSTYGPISHFILKDPPPEQTGADVGKKKKTKSRRGIVEFAKGNWGGCWACWKDHQKESSKGGVTLGEGVRAKWASGETPAWVDWASKSSLDPSHSNGSNGHAPKPTVDGKLPSGGIPARGEPLQPSISVPIRPMFDSAPSFGSAPDFGSTTMADLLASHNQTKNDKAEKKRQEDEFESMTLLKMRQMERERLEAQIRAEESD